MHIARSSVAGLLLLAALLLMPSSAGAAKGYDACAGFIDTLPATISTQGVWCLRQDLSTAITSGNAITIAANNVTVDCNDFKLGGLPAGIATDARGIHATDRLNATVRHCNVRGFRYGLFFYGSQGGGHLIEDNRFDGNTSYGIYVNGDGSVVRRNLVNNTGGSSVFTGFANGIFAENAVDILHNTVGDVVPSPNSSGNASGYGIYTNANPSGRISGNRVRGMTGMGSGTARGIYNLNSGRISLDGNHVIGNGSSNLGLRCTGSGGSRARDNIINGFVTGLGGCGDAGGNDVN